MDERGFLSQIRFNPDLAGSIGIEREFFLAASGNGSPTNGADLRPESPNFLKHIKDGAWGYELSACQVEHRTGPSRDPRHIAGSLQYGTAQGIWATVNMGLKLLVLEVAPESMPLDVYPHDDRYRRIVATLPRDVLSAACRVAGVHLHYGTRDIAHAIRVHNRVARNLDELIRMGDHSQGERMRLYRVMAKNWMPPMYESPAHFHATAREQGFENNVRDCWHLVRISLHGTVELRMFGMTANNDEIVTWVQHLWSLVRGL